jgi:hypothetical protein
VTFLLLLISIFNGTEEKGRAGSAWKLGESGAEGEGGERGEK